MKLRLPAVAAAVLIAAALLAPSALAASTTVVIAQFATRGQNGGNDEFIQIRNVSATAQDIGGWQIWGTNSGGMASARATVPSGTSLPVGTSFLFTNGNSPGYSGPATGDVTYSTGITDTGGIQLRDAAGGVIDAAGHSALAGAAALFKEGGGLALPTLGHRHRVPAAWAPTPTGTSSTSPVRRRWRPRIAARRARSRTPARAARSCA